MIERVWYEICNDYSLDQIDKAPHPDYLRLMRKEGTDVGVVYYNEFEEAELLYGRPGLTDCEGYCYEE